MCVDATIYFSSGWPDLSAHKLRVVHNDRTSVWVVDYPEPGMDAVMVVLDRLIPELDTATLNKDGIIALTSSKA